MSAPGPVTAPPLPTLLSKALVGLTIELDSEFERRMPHQTTNHGGTPGAPWLLSMAMWFNCMRFVGADELGLDELARLARTGTNLNGMERWGYVVVDPRRKTIRATRAGLRAREIWQSLTFESNRNDQLWQALEAVVGQLDFDLPDCLPILGYGLWSRAAVYPAPEPTELPLPALLSRALLAFALEFERESVLSLAICANILRILDAEGVRMPHLPGLSGVSKEAINMAMGILTKMRFAVVEKNPASGRFKVARLTPHGVAAQNEYRRLLDQVEQRWRTRFGEGVIENLKKSLEPLASRPVAELYKTGWRASVQAPQTLPHFPMVLHRGGFPDGS